MSVLDRLMQHFVYIPYEYHYLFPVRALRAHAIAPLTGSFGLTNRYFRVDIGQKAVLVSQSLRCTLDTNLTVSFSSTFASPFSSDGDRLLVAYLLTNFLGYNIQVVHFG